MKNKKIFYTLVLIGVIIFSGIQIVKAVPNINILGNYAVVGNGLTATTTANANLTASGTIAFVSLGSSGNPCLTIGTDGKIATSTCGGGTTGVSTSTPFTAGYIPFATSSSAITNSNIFQSGSNIGVGNSTPAYTLDITGNLRATTEIISNYFTATSTTATSTFGGYSVFNNYLDIKSITHPSSPATGYARLHATTANGITELYQHNEAISDTNIVRDNVFIAKNTSGSTITPGQVVYVTGSVGVIPTISLAKADNISTISPTIGMVLDSITNNSFGQVMLSGIIESINTSAFTASDIIYVSTSTAGGLVNIKPSYPYFTKGIGVILNSSAGNGSILVSIAPFLGGTESGTTASNYTFGGNANVLGVASSTNFFTTNATTTLLNGYAPSRLAKQHIQWSSSYTTSTNAWYDPIFIFDSTSTILKVWENSTSTSNSLNYNLFYGSTNSASSSMYKVFSSDRTISSLTNPTSTATFASSTPCAGCGLFLYQSNASSTLTTINIFYEEQ